MEFTASILGGITARETANVDARDAMVGEFTPLRFVLLPHFTGDSSEGRDMNSVAMSPFLTVRHKTSQREFAIHVEEADKWLSDSCA